MAIRKAHRPFPELVRDWTGKVLARKLAAARSKYAAETIKAEIKRREMKATLPQRVTTGGAYNKLAYNRALKNMGLGVLNIDHAQAWREDGLTEKPEKKGTHQKKKGQRAPAPLTLKREGTSWGQPAIQ